MFAVVIVACLIVLTMRYTDTSGSAGDRVSQVFGGDDASEVSAAAAVDDPRTRELVMSQANLFMNRINTYGPSDLAEDLTMPGYVERVDEVITPKLSVEFEKSVNYAEQSVAQAGLARSIQLYATGAESIGDDIATVLITGEISQSYPDPSQDEGRIEFEPLQFRYEVSLVKTDGTWLVDDFTPVRGEVEGEPTDGAPTGVPDDTVPDDPTGTNLSPVAQRYVAIIARRQANLSVSVTALDDCRFPTAATVGDTTCVQAPRAVGASARTLALSLRAAANPDSKVFVGAPPAAIADLVDTTGSAANAVVSASTALRPACVTTQSRTCLGERNALVASVNRLITALDGWKAVS